MLAIVRWLEERSLRENAAQGIDLSTQALRALPGVFRLRQRLLNRRQFRCGLLRKLRPGQPRITSQVGIQAIAQNRKLPV